MVAITTTGVRPKAFSWSYSKLKNFETCPKRHYEIDVAKNIKEEDSEQLKWGNLLHDGFAKRLGKNKIPLPVTLESYEPLMKRLEAVPGEILVENKFAITSEFAPCDWFAKDAWYRGIADVAIINGQVALAIDYKTGKILEDGVQLALMAACMFAHFPQLQAIRTEFFWIKDDAQSRADFKRPEMIEMWRGLWPRIEALKQASETMTYPPKSGGLCKRYCPVVSCPYHGK